MFVLSACCKPGLDPAFHAAVLAVIGLIASAALISFDAAFIARPSVCILTPSCVDNSVSNSTFSYGFQQSFFTVFNGWAPFKNYGQSHVKFLCQTIQVGVGALSFILYIIYIVIYYSSWKKSKEQVHPDPSSSPPQPPTSRPQHPAVYPPYNAQLPYPIQPGYYPPQQPGPPNYYPPPQPPVPPGYPPVPPGYPPVQPPIPQGYPLAQQPVPQGYPPVQPPAPQGYPPAQPPPPAQSGYYPAPPRQYPPPGPPHAVWRPPMYGQQPVPGAVPWN